MEASAIHAPAGVGRGARALPLLRLRSDEQLLAHFRAGSEEAFGILHDRYRTRLFAYVRQMLSPGSRQDAEDVLQDVFVRAYGALRADRRDVNVRAWLYRVAHNRCIDQLRRPAPAPADVLELSRKPLQDPLEEAQRREDLRRLVQDIARLPEQQRSALLMRELDGMSYAELALALDVTVPAVKSLLVRARIGLVEAAEARDADCAEIRNDLLGAYDRGVKASGRARRHMRGCQGCREYRAALRGVRRSFAALVPVGAGPLALFAKVAGVGAGGAGGAAGGTAAAGGGVAVTGSSALATGGGLATLTACKVAAVVCTAVVAGSAVEVKQLARAHHPSRAAATARAARAGTPVRGVAASAGAGAAAPIASASGVRAADVAVPAVGAGRRAASAPAEPARTRSRRVASAPGSGAATESPDSALEAPASGTTPTGGASTDGSGTAGDQALGAGDTGAESADGTLAQAPADGAPADPTGSGQPAPAATPDPSGPAASDAAATPAGR